MRTLLFRFVITLISILLVVYGLPVLFPQMRPIIEPGDWQAIGIFSLVLALVNTFIRPILKLLALPITCLTAGIFSIVINVLMFFLAAWLSNTFLNTAVQIDWLGAIIGALVVGLVGFVVNMFLEDDI